METIIEFVWFRKKRRKYEFCLNRYHEELYIGTGPRKQEPAARRCFASGEVLTVTVCVSVCVCVCVHQQPLSLCCLGVGELLHAVSWELCGVMWRGAP